VQKNLQTILQGEHHDGIIQSMFRRTSKKIRKNIKKKKSLPTSEKLLESKNEIDTSERSSDLIVTSKKMLESKNEIDPSDFIA
jgi:hypothetical protein